MKILLFSVLAIFVIGLFVLPDAFAELTITDDSTGGDCSTVGTWDAGTRTCTFTSDVSESIVVGSNNITLDGNGKTLTGSTNQQYHWDINPNNHYDYYCTGDNASDRGISFNAKTNLVIKNFILKNWCYAIHGENSINNTFQGNTIIENLSGLLLTNSDGDLIHQNEFLDLQEYGISLSGFDFTIRDNAIGDVSNEFVDPDNFTGFRSLTTWGINVHAQGSGVNIIEDNYLGEPNGGLQNGILVGTPSSNADYITKIKNNNIGNIKEIGITCSSCEIFDNVLWNSIVSSIHTPRAINAGSYVSLHDNSISGWYDAIHTWNNPVIIYHNYIEGNEIAVSLGNGISVVENQFVDNGSSGTGNNNNFNSMSSQWWINNPEVVNSGNYWSDYSLLCADSDNDNFCDDPYPFSGGTILIEDNYVWTARVWDMQINNHPGHITLESFDSSGVVGTWPNISVYISGVSHQFTCDPSSGTTFSIGTTPILCTLSGGNAHFGFDVTVNLETTSPVINVPADITINLAQGETESAATFSVDATDNFAVTVGPTCSAESGAIFQIGSNTVTCTAADAAGNVGTGSFTVQVIEYDSTPPVVTIPSNISLYEIASNVGAVGTFSVSANDNVDGTVATTCDTASGATFPVGITTITCTAQDANGNAGTASFTITVAEYVAPYLVVSNVRLIDLLGNTISEAALGQQVEIAFTITNDMSYIIDEDGYVDEGDISFAFWNSYTGPESDVHWITGQLAAGQSFDFTIGAFSNLTPQSPGDYTFTVRATEYVDGCYSEPAAGHIEIDDLDFSAQSCTSLSDPITLQLNVPLPPVTTTIQNAQGSSSPGCEPNCFIPSQASVSAGSQITFVNNDSAAHTSTSGIPSSGSNLGSVWDSSLMMSGSSFSVTLTNPGTYPYFCMVHPWMTGTIYVGTGIPDAPQPDAELSLSLNKNEFDLDELITVGASISEISGTADVTIDVTDPNGNPVITRMLEAGNTSEQLDFKISDRFVVGYYKISASSNIGGNVITDHIYFNIKSQYDQFQIESVQVTDQQGNASTLQRGEMAHIKVTLTSNINIEPLVTVNLFDSSLTTLGVGSIRSPINEGESEIILSFLIPEDAALGNGTIYVNAFTDWVSNGGVSLTGEVSKSENISS